MSRLLLIVILLFSSLAIARDNVDFDVYVDGQQRVLLEPDKYQIDFLENYLQLSDDQKQVFLKHREKVLIGASKKYLEGFVENSDGIYFGKEAVLLWGSHPPRAERVREAKAHFLLNYLENLDRQLFLNSRVIVEKREFGINISAVGSLLFWLPRRYLQADNHLPKGGVWTISMVVAYDKPSKGFHLNLSFVNYRPEQIFYLPGAELGLYVYASVFTGNGFFENKQKGPSVFTVASVLGYETSPQHTTAGVMLGHSQPPIISSASTYSLRESHRYDLLKFHVGIVPAFEWMNRQLSRLKKLVGINKCLGILSSKKDEKRN